MDDLSWKIKQSRKITKFALKKWKGSIGIAFTGRKDSTVMMHIILQLIKKPPKSMFIDTGLHYKESYKHLNRLKKLWKLDIEFVANDKLLNKLDSENNFDKKSEIATKLKIVTIEETIRKFKWKALFTAIRWDEHPARAGEKYFSKRKTHCRVHPLLHFNEKDIWSYIRKYKLPYISLYDKGYRSIGEKLFTKKVKEREFSERSGRDKNKEEMMERLRTLGYF